jgi:NifU-like protein involved in Fe-S cluster formation
MNEDLEANIHAALTNPQHLGEMADADAIGTVGSADCGDMLRMWVKFKDEDGRRVIDKATFQTFGCQTAIAVASMATDLIRGKTAEEALALSGQDLSAPLGPLPPMKIHCAQLVEGALKDALKPGEKSPAKAPGAPTLFDQLNAPKTVKITLKND